MIELENYYTLVYNNWFRQELSLGTKTIGRKIVGKQNCHSLKISSHRLFLKNCFIKVWLTYKIVYIFNIYDFMNLETNIHSWNITNIYAMKIAITSNNFFPLYVFLLFLYVSMIRTLNISSTLLVNF